MLSGLEPGWTYNTTALEGNSLTLAEVAQALAKPKAKIPHKSRKDVAATRAQGAANQALARWMRERRDLTKADLFSLHTILMQGSTVDSFKPIGAWKIEDNGTSVKLEGKTRWNDNFALASHVETLMTAWLKDFNGHRDGEPDPFGAYIRLHATFVRIPPFADGNGRLARLLALVPLVAAGAPVVDIPASEKTRYITPSPAGNLRAAPRGPARRSLPSPPSSGISSRFAKGARRNPLTQEYRPRPTTNRAFAKLP